MKLNTTRWAALAAAVVLAAGCSSSKPSGTSNSSRTSNSSGSPSTSSASGTSNVSTTSYTIGVLTDLTGVLANTQHSVPDGVRGAIGLYNSQGYSLKYVLADTGTTPAGALSAAQKLVEQDHVFAVILISGIGFAAAPYLTAHNIPVIGANIDSTEWITSRNMFSVFGTANYSEVFTTTGKLLSLLGAKNFAAVGYSVSPASAAAAKSAALSAQLAGVKVGYQNTQFPFGSTNVGPAVIAMKSAGVDSFIGELEQSTSFAIINGLRQAGDTLKAPIMAAGYGGDLRSAGPATDLAAQGSYFVLGYEPIELHTAATEQFANAMKTYAGVSADQITFEQYHAYASVVAFVDGLKLAGAHPTQAQFINAMLGIRSFDAAGLYGSNPIGFAMDQRGSATTSNCTYVVKWVGSSFELVPGAEPICGSLVPGKSA